MGAHALAPAGHRDRELLVAELRQRRRVLGAADDHLVRADRRLRAKEVGLGAAGRCRQRIDRAGEPALRRRGASGARRLLRCGHEHRIQVRHRAQRASRACPAPRRRACWPRPRAGFGARARCKTGTSRRRRDSSAPARDEGVRALGPTGREDRPQPVELVDPDLGASPGPRRGGLARASAAPAASRGSATTERSTAHEARAAA